LAFAGTKLVYSEIWIETYKRNIEEDQIEQIGAADRSIGVFLSRFLAVLKAPPSYWHETALAEIGRCLAVLNIDMKNDFLPRENLATTSSGYILMPTIASRLALSSYDLITSYDIGHDSGHLARSIPALATFPGLEYRDS